VTWRPGTRPIIPRLPGEWTINDELISTYPPLEPAAAVSLARAARLYQDAMWIAESQPQLSWLLLVSAVEAVAGNWRLADRSAADVLREHEPLLHERLTQTDDEGLLADVGKMIAPTVGSTRKFVEFSLKQLPDPPAVRPRDWLCLD
jgi:hypothetical protein